MSEVVIIQLTKSELQQMIDRAVALAAHGSAEKTGELWSVSDLASHYHVSTRTIAKWQRAGKLPQRTGRRWRRADVLRWDRDRAAVV